MSKIALTKRFFFLKVVKESPLALKWASKRFKDDDGVVLKAIKQNGYALKYASKRLRDSDHYISVAKKNYIRTFEDFIIDFIRVFVVTGVFFTIMFFLTPFLHSQ